MESVFKTTPSKDELKKIIKKIKSTIATKKLQNYIFSKSSLKHLNFYLEFYLFKNELINYYDYHHQHFIF